MATAIQTSGLLALALSLSLCGGCIVHTKAVESTVRGKMRTKTLPEDIARAQLATRITSKGLEVTTWQRQECTTQRLQEVRTVSSKQPTIDGPSCSGDVCGAILMLGMPITAVSLLVTVVNLAASDDEVIDSEDLLLSSKTFDCSRPIRGARVHGFVGVHRDSAMTDERGRALLSPSSPPPGQTWHLRVEGLPTASGEALDLHIERPTSTWTVVYEAPVSG